MMRIGRREVLRAAAFIVLAAKSARADIIEGRLPWRPRAGSPPRPATVDRWVFFSPEEAAAVEAVVDRIIPPDPQTPGGKDAGCAHYIDNQLAGPYGSAEGLYRTGPFEKGTKEQGEQSALTPAALFRAGLQELEVYCKGKYSGKTFAQLPDETKDEVLTALEHGSIEFKSQSSKSFFHDVLKSTREGFLADPIYGGNRGMCGWIMIGFPGARYNHRDWVSRHNQRYPLPPVSIQGRADWSPDKA